MDDFTAARARGRKQMLAGGLQQSPSRTSGSMASAAAAAHASAGVTAPAAASPGGGMDRRTSVLSALTSSDRFKRDESAFLSRALSTSTTSNSSSSGGGGGGSDRGSPQWKQRDREELDRLLDTSSLHAGTRLSGDTKGGFLGSVDEVGSLSGGRSGSGGGMSIGTFPPLSPRSPLPSGGSPSGPQPTTARSHARRPSYMQNTQQELKRQAELREAQAARERRAEEERSKSTRKAQGMTTTDLYLQQQAELEARRLATVDKVEAERRAERARFLAKFEGEHSSGATTTRPRLHIPSPPSALHILAQAPPLVGPALTAREQNEAPSSSAADLQEELRRRERMIQQDALGGGGGGSSSSESSSESSSSSEDDAEGDDDDGDAKMEQRSKPAQHGRRKGGNSADRGVKSSAKVARSRRAMQALAVATNAQLASNLGSPLQQARMIHAGGSPHAGSTGSALSTPLSGGLPSPTGLSGFASSLDVEHSSSALSGIGPASPASSRRPHARNMSSLSAIYDPSLHRRAGETNLPLGAAAGLTGMDLHETELDFRRAQRKAELRGAQVKAGAAAGNISQGFGRMTAAQLERSLDQLEKKKQLDQKAADSRSNHAHAVEQAQQQARSRHGFPAVRGT